MQDDQRIWKELGLRTAVLDGDQAAWREWYLQVSPCLEKYVAWRCARQHDLTEEILQETWLFAIHRLRDFDPKQGSFQHWLQGIAANLLRNWLRKHTRDRNREKARAQKERSDSLNTQQSLQIMEALAKIPDEYETVLRLKYVESFSVAEIAAHLGESAKAIESRLTRARQAFRDSFERSEFDHATG